MATLSVNTAKRIMEDLRTGVPTPGQVSSYSVGRRQEIRRLRNAMTDASLGHPQVLFIRGDWGAGKSHLLMLFEEKAKDANFLISHVTLSDRETPLHRLHIVYGRIMSNLRSNSATAQSALVEMVDKCVEAIFEKAGRMLRQKCKHGLTYETCSHFCLAEKVKKVTRDLFPQLSQQDWVLATALQHFVWARLRANETLKAYVSRWLLGEKLASEEAKWISLHTGCPTTLPNSVGERDIITLLLHLSTWTRMAGYGGIAIFFDEAESIPSLSRRQSAIQAYINFARIVDTIRKSGNIMFVYATTPTFYEDIAFHFLNVLRNWKDLSDFADFLEGALASQTITLKSLTFDDLVSLGKKRRKSDPGRLAEHAAECQETCARSPQPVRLDHKAVRHEVVQHTFQECPLVIC